MSNKEGLAAGAERGPCPCPQGLVLRDRHAACDNARAEPTAPRISVVIPALNEARNLPYVLANLPRDIYQVILVDGPSTDDTVAVARRLYPDVRVVRQTRRGNGDALACKRERKQTNQCSEVMSMPAHVIIPTYNERENLRPLVAAVLAVDAGIDILVVDDNSPDGTGALAERLADEWS
jgi:cellulose synthase/poly-beta-1,6-N-acetylglucosamine synthase-like glycosyltransferase